MKAHAALPDRQDLERVSKIVGGLEEQDLTQAATQDDTEHAIEQQVVNVLRRPSQLWPAPGVDAAKHDEQGEGQQVHQAIPVDADGAKREGDGIELWMLEHEWVWW
ncbi:hypothetical protein SDC9_170319 [bioreactor metagenome]|uniref:Uncharacterized protein n=1 Tax=bioreactor metagenome TaxID=1076179 RepID=A0A645GGC7_9ZZZZ